MHDSNGKPYRFIPVTDRCPADMPITERLQRRTQVEPGGCWLWTGPISNRGYGLLNTKHKSQLVHRASYEVHRGPIPGGMTLDHLCRVRHCLNPEHLEPVTAQENILRSPFTMASRWARRTSCVNGHVFTPENTMWVKTSRSPGKRHRTCRICHRANSARTRAKAAAK